MKTLKEFLSQVIVESLHPELQQIITAPRTRVAKLRQVTNKIKELSARGEKTGVEGNTPKGSSRLYIPHSDPMPITIDGQTTTIKTGTKVAISGGLNNHHNESAHDGMSLGNLQNEAENSDYLRNQHYRILSHDAHFHDGQHGSFTTNTESGIFPPLIDHDHENHEWSHVGHVNNITKKKFKQLTKTKDFPEGIEHWEFMRALDRDWKKANGQYWHKPGMGAEEHLDHMETHPLIQKFLDHQRTFGFPPHDFDQIQNLGVWKHPHTEEEHILARDHGFDSHVQKAYGDARKVLAEKQRRQY